MRIINYVNYLSTPIIPVAERKNYPCTLKVRAIALAIFTLGIFFIGSLAYTAYKQHQAKKVTVTPVRPLVPRAPIDPATLKAIPDNKLKEKVVYFVNSFLHPYITGQINYSWSLDKGKITEQTDELNRKSMVELLIENLEDQGISIDEIKITNMALAAYLKAACLGLYVNQRARRSVIFTADGPEFQILKKAVDDSFPKDFPNTRLTPKALDTLLKKALENVNKLRKEASVEPLPMKEKTKYIDLDPSPINRGDLFDLRNAYYEAKYNPNNIVKKK